MDCNISIVGITHMEPVLALNEAIVYENGSEALTTFLGNTRCGMLY